MSWLGFGTTRVDWNHLMRAKQLNGSWSLRIGNTRGGDRRWSHIQWLSEGDRNTHFFHRRSCMRRQKYAISQLTRPDGSTTDYKTEWAHWQRVSITVWIGGSWEIWWLYRYSDMQGFCWRRWTDGYETTVPIFEVGEGPFFRRLAFPNGCLTFSSS